jgi:hypothetical protein
MAYTVKDAHRSEVSLGAGIAHQDGWTAVFHRAVDNTTIEYYRSGVREQLPAKEFGLVVTGTPDEASAQ